MASSQLKMSKGPRGMRPDTQKALASKAQQIIAGSDFGRYKETEGFYVRLDNERSPPILKSGGSHGNMTYFINLNKVDEKVFRAAFLGSLTELKVENSPRPAHIDELGMRHAEVKGDPKMIRLIDRVEKQLNIQEHLPTDVETVMAGLQRRLQAATFAGDDVKVVQILKSLKTFKKNKALFEKSQVAELNLKTAVEDAKFGNSGYAYQKPISAESISKLLSKNEMLESTVLDAITVAANEVAIDLSNKAVLIKNGKFKRSDIKTAADQALYDAVVGNTQPRNYIAPTKIAAIVDKKGRRIADEQISVFNKNPQSLRYGEGPKGGPPSSSSSSSSSSSGFGGGDDGDDGDSDGDGDRPEEKKERVEGEFEDL